MGIFYLIYLAAFAALILGLIKPNWFIKKNIPCKRLIIAVVAIIVIVICNKITEPLDQQSAERRRVQDSIKKAVADSIYLVEHPPLPEGWVPLKIGKLQMDGLFYDTIKKDVALIEGKDTSVVSQDKFFSELFNEQFDTLYQALIKLPSGVNGCGSTRTRYHEKIQNLLYEDWWNTMMFMDSSQKSIPLNKKLRDKAIKLYDTQYANYLKYGPEDAILLRADAISRLKRGLKSNLHDPKSLEILEDRIKYGKTSKGWQFTIPYRAKNMFGAYVLESMTFSMKWDNDQRAYVVIK